MSHYIQSSTEPAHRQPSDTAWFVQDRTTNGCDYLKLIAEPGSTAQQEHDALVSATQSSAMQASESLHNLGASIDAFKQVVSLQTDVGQHGSSRQMLK